MFRRAWLSGLFSGLDKLLMRYSIFDLFDLPYHSSVSTISTAYALRYATIINHASYTSSQRPQTNAADRQRRKRPQRFGMTLPPGRGRWQWILDKACYFFSIVPPKSWVCRGCPSSACSLCKSTRLDGLASDVCCLGRQRSGPGPAKREGQWAWASKKRRPVGLGSGGTPGPAKREGQWAWAQGAGLGQQEEKASGPEPRGRAWASKKRKPVSLGVDQKHSGPEPAKREGQWALASKKEGQWAWANKKEGQWAWASKRESQWAWAQGAGLDQQKEKASGPGPTERAWASEKTSGFGPRERAWATKKRRPGCKGPGPVSLGGDQKRSGPGPAKREGQWASASKKRRPVGLGQYQEKASGPEPRGAGLGQPKREGQWAWAGGRVWASKKRRPVGLGPGGGPGPAKREGQWAWALGMGVAPGLDREWPKRFLDLYFAGRVRILDCKLYILQFWCAQFRGIFRGLYSGVFKPTPLVFFVVFILVYFLLYILVFSGLFRGVFLYFLLYILVF